MVVSNIVDRSYAELLSPLDYDQVAPIGFLFIQKFFSQTLGKNELVYRLFPFICSLSSLALFVKIVKNNFKQNVVIISTALFALSDYLIRYSAEAKQFGCDLTITLLLYFMLDRIQDKKRLSFDHLFFGIIGAFAVWLSHPSVFVMAGVGSCLFYTALKEWDLKKVLWILCIITFWVFSFAIFYYAVYFDNDGIINREQSHFSHYFLPLKFWTISGIQWLLATFFYLFLDPGGFAFRGLAAFSFLVGVRALYSENRIWLLFLMSPVIIALAISGLKIYPFRGRLLMFLMPAIIIFVALGVEYIRQQSCKINHVIGIVLIALIFMHPILNNLQNLATGDVNKTTVVEDIKPILSYIKENKKKDDILYIYYSAKTAFDFYHQEYELEQMKSIIGVRSRGNTANYEKQIKDLSGNDRVWFLFSHVYPFYYNQKGITEERIIVEQLNSIGKKNDQLKSRGASVYLYDLKTGENNAG